MAALPLGFGSSVFAATAAKGASGGKEEKSFFDWMLGKLTKEDQFYETDPMLQKVEEKAKKGTTSSGRKNGTVSIPGKKKTGGGGTGGIGGGLGGIFSKK